MATFDVVFEGGGAKGACFVGVLQVLAERGHTLRRRIGTSAGAITAVLSAAGYSPAEMLAAVTETTADGRARFETFLDRPDAAAFAPEERRTSDLAQMLRECDIPGVPSFLEDALDAKLIDALLDVKHFAQVFSLVERGGWYAGQEFRMWLREKLAAKGSPQGETLAQFHARTGSHVSVVISDTSAQLMRVLNHRTAPDVPVEWAVRMSMSIPLVWQEVRWREGWGTYLGQPITGDVIVDGGLLSNFPIRLLLDPEPDVLEIMGAASPENVIGLLIDEGLEVPGAPAAQQNPVSLGSLKLTRRLSRLVDTMTGAADMAEIREHEDIVCRLPAKGYGTLEFGLSGQRLASFLAAARQSTTAHLASRGL